MEKDDPLSPIEEKYTLMAYADDVKPAIRSKEEYILVDKASSCLRSVLDANSIEVQIPESVRSSPLVSTRTV